MFLKKGVKNVTPVATLNVKMAIYTKTGDGGETSLYSKDKIVRVSKSSDSIEIIGMVDEVNSLFGVVESFSQDKQIKKTINDLQKDMFTLGAILAGAKLRFPLAKTKNLEKTIDHWEAHLPVLKNFILPGGSKEASLVFYARTLVRKLERRLVSYTKIHKLNPEILRYVNRLSDFMFVLGRKINFLANQPEEVWKR